ncbi:MAG: nuclear transport factor 2 family protein [Candidatus Paceibacterota bacterium]
MEITSLVSIIVLSVLGTLVVSRVFNPYHSVVKKLIKDSFKSVNEHKYDEVLKGISDKEFEHVFAGDNSLGGARHDKESFKRWLIRVGTVLPELNIDVQDIEIIGMPNNTLVIARWIATCNLLNGDPYVNKGVHFITLRWGKVVKINVYEDTQTVTHGLGVQFEAGIKEAKAPKIES